MNKRRRAIIGIRRSLLPPEYQQVEYIESTGTQYINTGFTISSTDIECAARVAFRSSTEHYFCGAFTSSPTSAYFTGGTYQNKYYAQLGKAGSVAALFSSATFQLNTFVDYVLGNNSAASYLRVDGVTSMGNPVDAFPTNSIYIFQANNYPYVAGIQIASFKITQNNQLVRNYIPCYRKADGAIGMYDLVGGQFYGNAGTGVFLKGSDVALQAQSVSESAKKTTTPQIPEGHIYYNGNECVDKTGGWEPYVHRYNPILEKLPNALHLKGTGDPVGFFKTINAIDFTNYSKLKVKGDLTLGGSFYTYLQLGVNTSGQKGYPGYNAATNIRQGTDQITELNISNLSGNYYVYLFLNAYALVDGYIKEVWLE